MKTTAFKTSVGLITMAIGSNVVFAAEPITVEANVALATDYVFRGFSQTNEDPAISGGFDLDFGNGFSLGTWASNVNFGGSNTSTEIDLYAGYSFALTESTNLDLGYVYFAYPGDTDALNYSEFTAAVSVSGFDIGLVYSTDYFGSDADAFVINLDYSFDLGNDIGLGLHVGYSDVDEEGFFAPDEDSYVDYSVALSKSFAGIDASLTFYGTDVDDIDAADERLVFAIGKSF